jgi:glycerol-3-phosphate acyltransferase PlsY
MPVPAIARLGRLSAAAATGYALGTIPSADVAARIATEGATDLRLTGTGNPGAANAMAVLGKKWGLAVMAADIAKGAAAATIGRGIAKGDPNGAHLAGTAAVIGHCLPVWNGFRGGKGVATGVGQCLATFPASVPVNLAVAVGARRPQARATTVVGLAAWVAAALVWHRKKLPNLWGPPPTAALPAAAAASSAVILWRFFRARGSLGALQSASANCSMSTAWISVKKP